MVFLDQYAVKMECGSNCDVKSTFSFPCRVGIIGEPMSGFNPLTLAPFGEEHEEETGDEAGSRRRYNLERILIGCRLTRVIITAN